jgi:hypothetical protein
MEAGDWWKEKIRRNKHISITTAGETNAVISSRIAIMNST